MVRLVELSKQQIQYGICTINNEKSICRATAAPAMTRPKTHHGPNGPERDRRKGKYIHTIFHSFARILFPIHSAHRVRIWCVRFSVIFAVCASFSICLCVFLSHSLIHSVDVCVCVCVADDWYTFYIESMCKARHACLLAGWLDHSTKIASKMYKYMYIFCIFGLCVRTD